MLPRTAIAEAPTAERRSAPRALVAATGVPGDGVPEEWRGVVAWLGLGPTRAGNVVRLAAASGTSFQHELVASGFVSEEALCREMARELAIPVVDRIEPGRLVMEERHCLAALAETGGASHAMMREGEDRLVVLVSPARVELARLLGVLQRQPELRERMRLVRPTALRAAIMARSRHRLDEAALHGLRLDAPHLSAATVLSGRQGIWLGASVLGLFVALAVDAPSTWLALHALFSFFFLSGVVLRLGAFVGAPPFRLAPLDPVDPSRMPVYTVLVALYREAEIVPQLMVALSQLKWPRGKLEIKLVCEEDDTETLAAIGALRLNPCVEVMRVPPGLPRTKPRALAFALPASSGSLVALYDAEDRPHPDQLLEAWQRFERAEPEVACLQAPLVVTNAGHGFLQMMFAFEYAALFRALLPWLARRRLILPLGGTSNHFRRAALENVGGWDAHNVTEDADIGVRLARFGYRADTISRPTFEDAPLGLSNWTRQRTRWLKGWMQTWFVHMRRPLRLSGEVGPASFLLVQVLCLGMVVCALAYPMLLATIVWLAAFHGFGGVVGVHHATLLLVDAVNVLGGLAAFLLLGYRTLTVSEKRRFPLIVLATPIYWLCISFAAWRALWQLYRSPHHWEKTHHAVSRLAVTPPASPSPGR